MKPSEALCMKAYGTLWSLMEPYEALWRPMEPYALTNPTAARRRPKIEDHKDKSHSPPSKTEDPKNLKIKSSIKKWALDKQKKQDYDASYH